MRFKPCVAINEFKFLFNRLPFYVVFYPTSRCNATCPHCFNYIRQNNTVKKEELSLDEINKISVNFGHIKVLTITGGEPFLRDDLSEIVSIFHKNNGTRYISFHTNAFLTEKVNNTISNILDRFKDVHIIVCISIDNIGESHNQFRGVKDGFSKLLETIARLKILKKKYSNLDLIASTILSHTTMKSFPETMRFIRNDIGGVGPVLGFIRGSVRDKSEKEFDPRIYEDFYRDFKPKIGKNVSPFSPLAINASLEMLTNKIVLKNYRSMRQTVPCHAGRRLVVIYENGDVFPCETLNNKFGNLREYNYDIKQILSSPNAKSTLKEINKIKSCYCTWENVIPVNLLFHLPSYPNILCEWMRLFIFNQRFKG